MLSNNKRCVWPVFNSVIQSVLRLFLVKSLKMNLGFNFHNLKTDLFYSI